MDRRVIDEMHSVAALVPDEGCAGRALGVLGRWYAVTGRSPARPGVPGHVVGCDPRGGMVLRDVAALALRLYAAGSTEVWLLPDTDHSAAEQMPRLLPRLVPTAA